MNQVLGFDIGGSSIKTAPVNLDTGDVSGKVHSIPLPQPPTPAALISEIETSIRHLGWSGPVGVGFPGVIKSGRTWSAAHLGDEWLGFDMLSHLRSLTTSPVALINDADAAGLAEMRFGSGREYNCRGGGSVLVITLGTGIGSAFFYDGRLFPNTEFGHMEVDGAEAENRAAASIRARQDLDWEIWGKRVNRFLQEMEKLISPDLIIIGGGVSENFDLFRPYLMVKADVVPALLGNNAGLLGAALATASPDQV